MSRFYPCKCVGPQQCESKAQGQPCEQYKKPHRYPPIADEAERQCLEQAYEAEGGHVDAVGRAEEASRARHYDEADISLL